MKGLFGVISGVYQCNLDRSNELNERIYERNVPSSTLQPQFGIRPVATKYELLPIFDRRMAPTVPIKHELPYNIESVFNPGTAQAPWSGFAQNVNNESRLRNQFFALQTNGQSAYIPSSTSDMYQVNVNSNIKVDQPFPNLFNVPTLEPFNPDENNIATNMFDNCTRQQLKNINC
jgi:hypothetical protein